MDQNNIADKIRSGAKIIDVRSAEEYQSGYYPGAVNIPLQIFHTKLADMGPKDGEIVLYCLSGGRSGKAKEFLEQAGFTKVSNAGGLVDMPSL